MKPLTLKSEDGNHSAEVITLTLQMSLDEDSSLYTKGVHDLPAGEYSIQELGLIINITKSDDNRHQFKVLSFR